MSLLIDMMLGRLPTTPVPGTARLVVSPCGALGHDEDEGQANLVCTACGMIGTEADFYWRRRKSGVLARVGHCKPCHIKQVAQAPSQRAKRGKS